MFAKLDDPSAPAAQPGDAAFSVASPTKLFWSSGLFLEKTHVFVVPPGHWRIVQSYPTSFCLGGPAFDVKQGEAIFAGSFDATDPSALDMSLEPVKAALGAVPLAQRLKPALYKNGETFNCGHVFATFLYVMEVPGASFVEGYSGGSHIRP
ncbi:MAG TPA: hypothetical protein VHU87_05735 [Rhizomicrobium sp.]|jgi:hypothetical protein|nr:hypothetical protein [Rhizomicrobium sp.]